MPEATALPLLDLDLDELGWTLNESDYIALIAIGETLTTDERN